MSGGIPSLALKDEDVTKFLASSTHIGATNLDFQMASYVFKRRSDGESSKKTKKQAVDCRRSTAAQFFVEDETETVSPDEIVQLLNDAIEPKEPQGTIRNLRIVKGLLLREPRLLDNFLDEVVNFQHDEDVKVRCFVIQFIEDVCKQEPQTLPKVVGNLDLMLLDNSISVQKRVIQATVHLFTVVIKWLSNARKIDEIMMATWNSFTVLKNKVFALLDSDNEGLRTLSLKLMEAVVIVQSPKDEFYELKEDETSLDDIPVILKVFRPRKMEEEAKELFEKIIDFHNASHVSGSNLLACMQVLTTIARKRFQFFSKVLQAYETLHANMPPTLSQSQVTSVRKSLKLQLFILVKHPAALEFQSQISIMLSDLGATPIQILKCFPAGSSSKKHLPKSEVCPSKQNVEDQQSHASVPKTTTKLVDSKSSAIDVTAEDLKTKFSNQNVADLVLVSMLSLPEVMPAQFQSTYTPIAAAGTDPQVQHLARLLATQMTALGIGKGIEMKREREEFEENSEEEDEQPVKKIQQIKTVLNRSTGDIKPKKQPLVLLPSGSAQPKIHRASKKIDFHINVKPLSKEDAEKFSRSAFKRIVEAEKAVTKKGAGAIRTKILTTLATQFGKNVASDLRKHILDNPRARLDLAFSWLYQEYAACKGFEGTTGRSIEKYEEAVNQLLLGVISDEPNNLLFYRFFLDLPCVTEGMANALKQMSSVEKAAEQTFEVAKSMCLRRPPQKLLFLDVISDLTLHESESVRMRAVDAAVEIYEGGFMISFIEAFALRSLKFLLDPVPDVVNFVFFAKVPEAWSDDLIKVCLNLYFSLLPLNHSMIFDLGTVYVETSADVKRTILRALEVPVKKISMRSPDLLRFVETCPQGAETFVTRIIHILTDKAPPSAELVAHVRDLYQKRVPDVRFLIPIINGLAKREVIAALPELIKLNPTVVKEVFHRLVGSNLSSPLSPAELLVALHNIDTKQCNLKTVIKATSLCFDEKQVYTQVVLAMVMQQLMEQNPLPMLLMRTVIQSLAHHPHLLGFVTNILQRLILKEVWKQPKIWEGFIRCCQRTKPQSFQVLLQLPSAQLEEVLTSYPDLRDPLCQHVQGFTEHQKAHLAADVIQVLESIQPKDSGTTAAEPEPMDTTTEPLPPGEETA